MDRAIPITLASATLYALVSIAVRTLLVSGISVEMTVFVRFAVSAVALLLVPFAFGKRTTASNTTRLRLFLLGAFLVGLRAMILFTALRESSTAPVVILFFTFPFWVVILSALIGIERLTVAGLGSLVLASVGALLVIDPTSSTQSLGLVPAGLAVLSAAMYAVFLLAAAKLLAVIGRVEGAGWVAAGATATSAAGVLLFDGSAQALALPQLSLLVATGLLGTVALLGYFYVLDRAGANVVALFGMWEPVMVAVLAAVLLNELLTPVQMIGGVVVIAGLTLRAGGRGSHRRTRADVPIVATPD